MIDLLFLFNSINKIIATFPFCDGLTLRSQCWQSGECDEIQIMNVRIEYSNWNWVIIEESVTKKFHKIILL